jgi:hypothetical protein
LAAKQLFTFAVRILPLPAFKPKDIEILIDVAAYALETIPAERIFSFEASLGWKGHIERKRPEAAA